MANSESSNDADYQKGGDVILKNPTVQPEIPDRRGPIVYDITETASLNGIDPNYMKKNGV